MFGNFAKADDDEKKLRKDSYVDAVSEKVSKLKTEIKNLDEKIIGLNGEITQKKKEKAEAQEFKSVELDVRQEAVHEAEKRIKSLQEDLDLGFANLDEARVAFAKEMESKQKAISDSFKKNEDEAVRLFNLRAELDKRAFDLSADTEKTEKTKRDLDMAISRLEKD